MKLSIRITKEGLPVTEVTAMIVEGPGYWPEIAAISNESGELSFQVEKEGLYSVRLFIENSQKTIEVKTGEAYEYKM